LTQSIKGFEIGEGVYSYEYPYEYGFYFLLLGKYKKDFYQENFFENERKNPSKNSKTFAYPLGPTLGKIVFSFLHTDFFQKNKKFERKIKKPNLPENIG
jgi:hypothetical protein